VESPNVTPLPSLESLSPSSNEKSTSDCHSHSEIYHQKNLTFVAAGEATFGEQ